VRRRGPAVVALLALAWAGAASGAASGYQLAPTQSCLTHAGLNTKVEPPVLPALLTIEPYGSRGGLVWIESAPGEEIFLEFGKSPSEAASMRAAVIKLFGKTAASDAVRTKGNVMFYSNHRGLTSHEISTVERCLR
jgi:hypothetical protein